MLGLLQRFKEPSPEEVQRAKALEEYDRALQEYRSASMAFDLANLDEVDEAIHRLTAAELRLERVLRTLREEQSW